jgi:hypothetical protein
MEDGSGWGPDKAGASTAFFLSREGATDVDRWASCSLVEARYAGFVGVSGAHRDQPGPSKTDAAAAAAAAAGTGPGPGLFYYHQPRPGPSSTLWPCGAD